MKLNMWKVWGISPGIVLILLMIEAYADIYLHKLLAMLFIIFFIVHVISAGKKSTSKDKLAFFIVLMAIVITGTLNIVFKVKCNVTGQTISLLIHELGAWVIVILSVLHSIKHLKVWQRG